MKGFRRASKTVGNICFVISLTCLCILNVGEDDDHGIVFQDVVCVNMMAYRADIIQKVTLASM
jgi:hypothetical protein